MTNQQGAPEALFYADALDRCAEVDFDHIFVPAAAVIRRLHAENERLAALVEAQQPAPSAAADLHPKTSDLVQRFSAALADKLAAAEKKYGYSDGWASPDWMDECRLCLREHLFKGDPRDVAAYCAFLWHHGESMALPSEVVEDRVKEFEQLFPAPKPSPTPQADSAPAADPWRDHLADQADMIDCAALQRAMVQHGISFTEGGMEHFRASLGEMVNRFVRFAAPQADSAPTSGNWVSADDVNRLVRELDVALNGEAGAAAQASLCDVVAQVRREAAKRGQPLLAPQADSQPAPVRGYPQLPEPQYQMGGKGHSDAVMRAYVDADRAARTPASSVLEDAARLWDAFIEAWRNELGVDKIVNIMGGADKLKAVFLDAARKQGGA